MRLSDNEKINMAEELRAAEGSPPDDVTPGDRQQARHDGFSRHRPKVSKSADTHRSTDPEISLRRRDKEKIRSDKFPKISQRIAIVALCTVAIASASTVAASIFSILHREPDSKSFFIPVHSDTSRSIETTTNPAVSVGRWDAIEGALNSTIGILNAYFSQFREALRPDDRHLGKHRKIPGRQFQITENQYLSVSYSCVFGFFQCVPSRAELAKRCDGRSGKDFYPLAGAGAVPKGGDRTTRHNKTIEFADASVTRSSGPTHSGEGEIFSPMPVELATEVPHVDAATTCARCRPTQAKLQKQQEL